MSPERRHGHARLGVASFVIALLTPLISLACLALMLMVPNTHPPEVPDPGVIELMIAAALSFAIGTAAAFLLGLAAAITARGRRLFAWLGLAISSAELAVMLGFLLAGRS